MQELHTKYPNAGFNKESHYLSELWSAGKRPPEKSATEIKRPYVESEFYNPFTNKTEVW